MTGVPYPPNPPENPPHPFIPGSPGWLAYERGRAAADSWWRSRLVSDETRPADDRYFVWVCPTHGIIDECELAEGVDWQNPNPDGDIYTDEFFCQRDHAEGQDHRVRTFDLTPLFAALLPVNEPGCRAPHCWSEYGTPCGTCPVAAASPDDQPVMANMCEGESPDHKPGITAAATPEAPDEEGWSPGIDDPEPRALGDIDTGEGWAEKPETDT